MNLSVKLSDWQKNNLITASQKTAILDYENRVKRPMLFYSLLFLSCFCIGIGLIAIIAANWEIIPSWVKLLTDFVILFSIAWGIGYTHKPNKALFAEGLIICYALLILGSIGLIAQIFQLPAQGLSALLLWSLLTFPLLFLTSKPLLPGLWFLAFFISSYERLYRLHWFREAIDFIFSRDNNYGIWLTLFLMLIMYRLLKFTKLPAITGAWRGLLIAAFTLSAVLMDIFDYGFFSGYGLKDNSYELERWGISLLCFAGFWRLNRKTGLCPAFYALAIILAYIIVSRCSPSLEQGASALMVISLLAVAGIYAYRNHMPRLLNFITVLIALRFFGIYLEVFGSLLSTGFGLIASGLVFLAIAIIWQKLRHRLLVDIKEKQHE